MSTSHFRRSQPRASAGLKIRDGRFDANNAWLTCIAIAHNLTRAVATLAGLAAARAATIRRRLINIAGRVANHARALILHLPEHWPWQHVWQQLWTTVHPPPT